MLIALDHRIFGNGHGMASPYFDNRFYWLVDEKEGRENGHGELYTFSPGFGAQLHSYQWTHPNAGERRRLIGREFEPLHSHRKWGRVEIAWSMVNIAHDIDRSRAAINGLKADLDSTLMMPLPAPPTAAKE